MPQRQEAPEGEELEADANYVLQVLLDHDIYCLEAKRLPGAIRAYIDRLKAEKEAVERERDRWKQEYERTLDSFTYHVAGSSVAKERDAERVRAEKAEAEKEAAERAGEASDALLATEFKHSAQLANKLEAAEQSLEAVRRDAERYRYIRDAGRRDYAVLCEQPGKLYLKMNETLDAAIDAATDRSLLPGSDRG